MNAPSPRDWSFGAPVRGYHWVTSGSSGRILLQHGYGEYAGRFVERYSRLIPNLLDRGWEVFAIDMPGHGRSPGRRGSFDVRSGARHHLAAKRALAAEGPVMLFGHSLGGLVTARTVLEDPRHVSGVVLTSPAFPEPAGPLVRRLAAALAALAPHARAPLRSAPVSGLARLPENAELYLADDLIYKGKLTNLTARTALLTAQTVWHRAAQWTVPTLILHGTADRSTDPDGSARFFRQISSDDKTLQLIDEGRHELLNDLDRDAVLASILEWAGAGR